MKKSDRIALITLPIIILIGILVALAGSQGSVMVGGMPLFGLSVGLAFLIQWLVFIPAYLMQTEKFFDITGCTFSNNFAQGAGGGLFVGGSTTIAVVDNSTFANNTAGIGGGIWSGGTSDSCRCPQPEAQLPSTHSCAWPLSSVQRAWALQPPLIDTLLTNLTPASNGTDCTSATRLRCGDGRA